MGGNVSKFSTVAPAQAPQPVLIASALHPDAWADLVRHAGVKYV